MPVTTPQRRSSGAAPRRRAAAGAPRRDASLQLERLAFLHEFVRLATHARDWDELTRSSSIGRRERWASRSARSTSSTRRRSTHADCDERARPEPGRPGEPGGRTGHHRPGGRRTRAGVVGDVTIDPRFSWVRGFDLDGLHAMLSVPLVWHERVVGVLNVQTTRDPRLQRRRDRVPHDDRRAPRGHRREGPDAGRGRGAAGPPVRSWTRRAPSCSPSSPTSCGRRSRWFAPTSTCSPTPRPRTPTGGRATVDRELAGRRHRAGHAPRPARRLDPRLGPRRGPHRACAATRSTSCTRVDKTVGTLALLLRTRAVRWTRRPGTRSSRAATTNASARCSSTSSTTRPSTRRPSRPCRVGVWRTRRGNPGLHHRRRPGRPARGLGGRVPAVRPGGPRAVPRARGSGCSPRGA